MYFVEVTLRGVPAGGLKLESLSNVPRFYMRCIEALRFDPVANYVRVVGSSGLEPPTSRLSGARSNHLSYEPIQFSVYLVSLAYFVTLFFAYRFLIIG